MQTEIYAVIGVLCASEAMHYAEWGVLAASTLGGFLAGVCLTRWRLMRRRRTGFDR